MKKTMSQVNTILLVEDEPALRRVLADTLQESGFTVEEAESADNAWDMVHHGLHFDLLLTDIRMPGLLNGLDLARKVHLSKGRVPIIVMSAYSELARDESDFDAFLAKPFNAAKLTATLSRITSAGRT